LLPEFAKLALVLPMNGQSNGMRQPTLRSLSKTASTEKRNRLFIIRKIMNSKRAALPAAHVIIHAGSFMTILK